MEKLMKTSKTVDNFLKIIFWLMLVAGMLLIVGVGIFRVAKLVEKPDAEYAVITSIGVGNVELKFEEEQVIELKYVTAEMIIVSVTVLLSIAIVCYIVSILRKILAPMIIGQPFAGTVSKDLKKLGIVVIVGGIGMDVLHAVLETAVFYMHDVVQLFLSDVVSGIKVQNTIDLTGVLVGVLVLMLSHVFRYGEELQQQADETL